VIERILTTETQRTQRRQIIITAGVFTGNAGISDDRESNLKISEKLKMKNDKLRYCFAMIFEGILTTENTENTENTEKTDYNHCWRLNWECGHI
jgi:hypothetical protein